MNRSPVRGVAGTMRGPRKPSIHAVVPQVPGVPGRNGDALKAVARRAPNQAAMCPPCWVLPDVFWTRVIVIPWFCWCVGWQLVKDRFTATGGRLRIGHGYRLGTAGAAGFSRHVWAAGEFDRVRQQDCVERIRGDIACALAPGRSLTRASAAVLHRRGVPANPLLEAWGGGGKKSARCAPVTGRLSPFASPRNGQGGWVQLGAPSR